MLKKAADGSGLNETETATLLSARGADVYHVTQAADSLRKKLCGDVVSFVVNRNINYTNVCGYHCKFCAFSKGRTHEDLRGKPYNLDLEEIVRNVSLLEAIVKSTGSGEIVKIER